ncbi:ABC transporter substrate-binding protein [Bdellovibrio sp. KM01]|uniref:substrate-binding periplasmic protein n=1 Tax=Bdellovibrio sp. KM01 TaxID=2748865 RepID=UPI001C662649|nr:ABC transporter substrate-binding protein [Bdellovibrio sp. KM01]
MRLNNFSFLLILFAVSLIHETTAGAVATPPLTLLTEEWPPFNYTEKGELKGFATEVVKLIQKELNTNYVVELYPSARGMNTFENRSNVMFFSFIQTPDRKHKFKWIGPFGEQSIYFFKKKGNPIIIETLEDAKKVRRICCRDQGFVFNFLKSSGFKNLDVGVNPEGIYLKTIHGRCDLSIGEDSWGVAYWLKKSNLPPDALQKTSVKISSSPLYIAASLDIPDQEIQRWQKALDKVKASTDYQKINLKYKDHDL